MKKILFTIFFSAILISVSSYAKSNDMAIDKIIAVVNDDVVTKSELNRSLVVMKSQIAQSNVNIPSDSVLQKQALDQLINKKIQMQIAKQVGINITDADVDKVVQNVASKNNMSMQTLYEHINHDGMSTPDYRNELREQMTIQRLQQQEVAGHITVTPDEITHFMESKIWQNNSSKEYHLEDILIPLSDTPSSEEIVAAKQRAQSVITKLNQGQNFRDMAQQESGDHRALIGGDLGWRKLAEIPSAFAQHVVNMRSKEIAGPIQTPNGFHVIRLAEERAIDSKTDAPNRTEVEQLLMQRKFEEHAQNWVSKMRSQAFVKISKA